MPAMVPYLLQIGQATYQEAQLFWKELTRPVDRVEMLPPGRRISTFMNPFHPARREIPQERNGYYPRAGNDGIRKLLEKQLFPHLGQLVDAYV